MTTTQFFLYRGGVGADQKMALFHADVSGAEANTVFSASAGAVRRYGDEACRERHRLAIRAHAARNTLPLQKARLQEPRITTG